MFEPIGSMYGIFTYLLHGSYGESQPGFSVSFISNTVDASEIPAFTHQLILKKIVHDLSKGFFYRSQVVVWNFFHQQFDLLNQKEKEYEASSPLKHEAFTSKWNAFDRVAVVSHWHFFVPDFSIHSSNVSKDFCDVHAHKLGKNEWVSLSFFTPTRWAPTSCNPCKWPKINE